MRKITPIEKLTAPFRAFLEMPTSAGIVLILCTFIAILLANTYFSNFYFQFLDKHLTFEIESFFTLNKSILHWINDGLMCIFFFFIGLEIKREITIGELNSLKKATLPIVGALGGMIVPASIYLLFNYGKDSAHGWGIPMATDIAFSIGVLVLLGNRVSLATKVFLTALAVIDDLGAVIVIAVFYTDSISTFHLFFGFLLVSISALGNLLGIRNFIFYLFIGVITWILFIKSGVHATIAGVLLAFTIPSRTIINRSNFLILSRKYLDHFEKTPSLTFKDKEIMTHEQQHQLHKLETAIEEADSPLNRLEHLLKNWVSFLIIPIFALANAGVLLHGNIIESLNHPVSLGIIFGLFIGKQLGIFLFCWITLKLGLAQLSKGLSWTELYGASLLAGIGFTMSLFINGLAFSNPVYIDYAKIGILAGSLLSGLSGFFILYFFKNDSKNKI